jgi:hypothetical protein
MALQTREAFKVGFLARCAETGMSPQQMLQTVKEAQEKLAFIGGMVDKAVDLGRGAVTTAAGWGLPLALAAPPALGGVIGYGLGRAADIDDLDVQDIREQELLNEYARQTSKLQRDKQVKDYQKQTKKPTRVFL